jgi:hypothetical protein
MKRFPITNVENDLVAKYRDPDEKLYASLELNQVAFPKTGMVVSQTPLGAAFTRANPCENGMWVVADKAAGAINAPAAATDSPLGVVYTTEKEYDYMHYGLQRFGRKVAGDYPRVGIWGLGDTVTTNCLQYDDTEFEDEQDAPEHSALFAALEKDLTVAANALYVIPGVAQGSVNKAVPQITKTKPQAGTYAKIVKYYTIPNGGKGVKYQIVSLG